MDRNIVYPGAIPLDTDLLTVNRNAMLAIGALVGATLGTSTVVDGLAVAPTVPATLSVQVAPGSITDLTVVDQNAYGSLPADVIDPLMKMGINVGETLLAFTAPTASGQSINYLIEATFQESDINPVVMPYYNAANPAAPYLGPGNSGAAQNTARVQRVELAAKAGAAATTGTQVTPAVDAGWVPLAVVTVAYGQTQITSGSIFSVASANTIPFKLPALRPGFSTLQAFTASGTFVVPSGVTVVKTTVIGGGGSGGTHATLPAGGGGAGGRAVGIITGLVAGTAIAVTVGAAGVAPSTSSPAVGGSGGSSSFGSYVSATGGSGGGGGTASVTQGGGPGGVGAGGQIDYGGGYGTDAITVAGRGGDGGGPGNGRGTTGLIQGIAATGYGGGGGGGGASTTGAEGGNGGSGLVIVEY
jgi:hypothetical protein